MLPITARRKSSSAVRADDPEIRIVTLNIRLDPYLSAPVFESGFQIRAEGATRTRRSPNLVSMFAKNLSDALTGINAIEFQRSQSTWV